MATIDFQDQLRKRLNPDATPSTTGGMMPDVRKTVTLDASPEAAAAIEQGQATGQPRIDNPESNNAPAPQQPGMSDQLRSLGFGQPSGSAPPQNTVSKSEPDVPATNPANPPLMFHDPTTGKGQTNEEQAQTLAGFLAGQGFPVKHFAVGGTSPVDGQINAMIDLINAPGTSAAQIKVLSANLAKLVDQRADTVANPEFFWNSQTGKADPPGGETKTVPEIIGGIVPPANPGQVPEIPGLTTKPQTPTTPPVDTDLYNRLLALLGQGGITNEQQQLAEGGLVSDIEGAAQKQRQRLADQLGANGQFGGSGLDMLNQVDNSALAARAHGLANIRTGILQQQVQARGQALETLLRQMGMGTAEAATISGQLTQRAIAQAQLAMQDSQFGQNYSLNLQNVLGNQELAAKGLDLQGRGQTMDVVLALLQMEAGADESTKKSIEYLLGQFLSGGTIA